MDHVIFGTFKMAICNPKSGGGGRGGSFVSPLRAELGYIRQLSTPSP